MYSLEIKRKNEKHNKIVLYQNSRELLISKILID